MRFLLILWTQVMSKTAKRIVVMIGLVLAVASCFIPIGTVGAEGQLYLGEIYGLVVLFGSMATLSVMALWYVAKIIIE